MSQKEFTPTLLWCYFLGLVGAHRFYTGKIGTAILMLILTLTLVGILVTLIWVIVDFINIASGKFTDSDGNEIKQSGMSREKGLGHALIWGFFLGGFGAHRFYAGKTGTAIVMLILTLTYFLSFIASIWALVDMIYMAMGKFTDREGNEIGHLDAVGNSKVFE